MSMLPYIAKSLLGILCSRGAGGFRTKAASACLLLEIIDRVYTLKFAGLGTLKMY